MMARSKTQGTISVAEYRRLAGVGPVVHVTPYARRPLTEQPRRSDHALGRLEAGRMNRTESAYAEHLELLRRDDNCAVISFRFEAIKLRLAKRTFYEPDFMVVMADGSIEIHEVKGGPIEDDAAVKLKVAAALFPCFKFIIVRRYRSGDKQIGSTWVFKDVNDGL